MKAEDYLQLHLNSTLIRYQPIVEFDERLKEDYLNSTLIRYQHSGLIEKLQKICNLNSTLIRYQQHFNNHTAYLESI